jgi:hypothetical protein
MMGLLTAYPVSPAADASTLLVYQGAANRAVEWTLTGSGTLAALSRTTDHAGIAGARYTPGIAGATVLIEVIAGA